MKKFYLRHLLAWAGALLLAVAVTACDDYDDTELWKSVKNLKSRIEAIESQLDKLNGELVALRKIVDESVTVVKVETTGNGYKIYFSDGTTAEIADGAKGADGTDGSDGKDGADAPVIGVKQDTDGVYYWTVTTDGRTEWLLADGEKLRVTGESIQPVLGVDDEGYWTISYDGGSTTERILDAAGNPVSAVADDSQVGTTFRGVTWDENNAYFELNDGTVITVPIRSGFYMLIRKAPETATFVFGETKSYEVEAVGVTKTVLTKPDEWKVAYADGILSITAPTEAHKECADLEGTVAITYFSANGQADAATMKVVVEKDWRGETVGEEFTVEITDITDTNVKMNVTPNDDAIYWYMAYATQEKIDNGGLDDLLNNASNGYLSMLGYYAAFGYLDYYAYQGAATGFSFTGKLPAGTEMCAILFGFEPAGINDYNPQPVTLRTEVMLIPFKTKQPIVINTVYRIAVSDVSWYGARYTCVPSDDLGYFHGFVKKSEFAGYDDDAAFMDSRIALYRDAYRDELMNGLSWSDLTSTGTQAVVAPAYIEAAQATRMPLIDDTEYYAYAFACTDGDATSPLSKAEFKTGKYTPSENCTFEIAATVDRQDVTVEIIPSNRNVTYYCSVTRRAEYQKFETDLQFAVDDLLWAKVWTESQQGAISDLLQTGSASLTWQNLWAATGYVVCVYGVSADGTITTQPTVVEFVTKGTVDTASAPAQAARGGKFFRR